MRSLNLMAPVGKTGYGVAGFNILQTMVGRGHSVSLFPKGMNHGREREEAQLIDFAKIKADYEFSYDAPCINLWHQNDLAVSVGRGTYYGWPIFELDTFNEQEIHHLLYPDKLIVCSEWAKDIVSKIRTDNNIHVVPLGIDPHIFNPNVIVPKKSDNTIFLNIGKWEIRKGHDILYQAFNDAFSTDDNVELWMSNFNPFLTQQEHNDWAYSYLNSPLGKVGLIRILPWHSSQLALAHTMSMADCGVFPSRAEGWNLELLEMMAMGKSVITTNYSAHKQFCDDDNALLIDIDEVEPAYDGKWFFEQGNWATLGSYQFNELVNCMRAVHRWVKSSPNKRVINDAGIETGKKFTWDNTVDKLESILYG